MSLHGIPHGRLWWGSGGRMDLAGGGGTGGPENLATVELDLATLHLAVRHSPPHHCAVRDASVLPLNQRFRSIFTPKRAKRYVSA